MKRIDIFLLMLLAVISMDCNESNRNFMDSDLSFFNLKGRVKTFAEINVGIGLSATATFDTYAKQRVNFYEHYFSEKGELTKIENIHPSPYALNGFKISFHRDSNQLIISQDSPKEKYI